MLRARIDGALDASAAGILAIHRHSSISDGEAVDESVWLLPAAPSAGHAVRRRSVLHDASGAPVQDFETSFTMPVGATPMAGPGVGIDATGKDAAALRTTGSTVEVDYPSASWSRTESGAILVAFPDELAMIRAEVNGGGWTAGSGSPVRGSPVIVLTWHEAASAGMTHQLWVDARSYLPVKEIYAYRPGDSASGVIGTIESDYELLAPSVPNLAALSPPVPAGFTEARAAPDRAGA
jgi:hypothetical protein